MVNCNLQHYSGESGLTYFTQLFVIMLFQFITAATGMAAMAGVWKSMAAKTTKTIGNFWHYLVISCTRILFPDVCRGFHPDHTKVRRWASTSNDNPDIGRS